MQFYGVEFLNVRDTYDFLLLTNLTFFGLSLCPSNTDIGVDVGGTPVVGFTLGSDCTAWCWRLCVFVFTLGDAAVGECIAGISLICFNWVASIVSVLRTGSPACRVGTVVDGGWVKVVMISLAACLKNRLVLFLERALLLGKMLLCHSPWWILFLGNNISHIGSGS